MELYPVRNCTQFKKKLDICIPRRPKVPQQANGGKNTIVADTETYPFRLFPKSGSGIISCVPRFRQN